MGVNVTDVEFPCEQDGVLKLIPHRDPFVWVSRIVECEPGEHIVAELDVRPDLDVFRGHFPGKPVFPGVLLMEALAQASACCMMCCESFVGTVGFLTGLDKAKFRATVEPGDVVRLESTIVKANKRMCVAEVVAYKGDKVAAQATQKYILAKES